MVASLEIGMELTHINCTLLESMSFDSIMHRLKTSSKPLQLTFRKRDTMVVLAKSTVAHTTTKNRMEKNAQLIGINGYDVERMPLNQIKYLLHQADATPTLQWYLPSSEYSPFTAKQARKLGAATALTSLVFAASV